MKEERLKEQKKKAQKKYYEKHKDYYREQSLKESKRVRAERRMYKDRINRAIEYIEQYGDLYCLKHIQFKRYKQYEVLLKILKGE